LADYDVQDLPDRIKSSSCLPVEGLTERDLDLYELSENVVAALRMSMHAYKFKPESARSLKDALRNFFWGG